MTSANKPSCPLCGAPVPPGRRRCANCGAQIAVSGGEDPRTAPTSALYLCPSCGAFVGGTDTRCPKCGADLAVEGAGTPETESRPCPRCGATIHVAAEVCPSCGESVGAASEGDVVPVCPNCGSVARTGRQTCAVCGESLRPKVSAPARAPEVPLRRPPKVVPRPVRSTGKTAPARRPPAQPSVAPPPKRERTPPAEIHEETEPEAPEPPPPRPKPPVPTPVAKRLAGPSSESRLAPLRDVSAIATILVLPAVVAARSAGVPGWEWGQLFAFGGLLGIATSLTLPEMRTLRRPRSNVYLFLAGLVLLVAVPLVGYVGAGTATSDIIALAAGLGLLCVVTVRHRRGVGPLLAWTAGLLLLTVLAVSPFVVAPRGPPGGDAMLWDAGGALTLGGAGFAILRRWLQSAVERRIARGDRAHAQRRYGDAIESYDAAMRLGSWMGSNVTPAWYGKGAALVAAGRSAEALPVLERALVLDPGNEMAWINKGAALVRLGRMHEALKCYNASIKANPRYEVAWNNKGNALARLGKPELALGCYEKALQIDPAYRTAWVNKGFVLSKLGRFDEAAACADAALKLTTGASASA